MLELCGGRDIVLFATADELGEYMMQQDLDAPSDGPNHRIEVADASFVQAKDGSVDPHVYLEREAAQDSPPRPPS